jgi:hypothetical protein
VKLPGRDLSMSERNMSETARAGFEHDWDEYERDCQGGMLANRAGFD